MQGDGSRLPDLRPLRAVATTALPRKPRLAPWVSLVDLGDGRSQIRAAEFCLPLSHPLFSRMLVELRPFLDGTRTVDEILACADAAFEPAVVRFFLQLLRDSGILQEAELPSELTAEQAVRFGSQIQYLAHFLPDAAATLGRLSMSRITLLGSPALSSCVSTALEALGVTQIANLGDSGGEGTWSDEVCAAIAGCDLLIAMQDSAGFRFFEAVNDVCLSLRARWMHVALEGTLGLMGPTMVPWQTACYVCYTRRLASHRGGSEWDSYRASHVAGSSEGSLPPLSGVLANQVALEAARLLTGFAPPTTFARLYEFDARSPAARGHDVLRVPRCASCGRRTASHDPWDLNR